MDLDHMDSKVICAFETGSLVVTDEAWQALIAEATRIGRCLTEEETWLIVRATRVSTRSNSMQSVKARDLLAEEHAESFCLVGGECESHPTESLIPEPDSNAS